ncbi:MAG: 2Fe-2S iron-sulfur cluster-binding protein [Pseudomonadota bacterium]
MPDLVPLIALAALGAFALYMVVLACAEVLRLVRARAAHEAERELLNARISQLSSPISRLQALGGESAWSGFRKFVLQGKVLEAEDTCSFYFAPHDGQPLPAFLPGQYLTFRLPIPGHDRPLTRCYSLSDSPTHPDYYRVTVKRLKGEVDGLVSTFLHQELQPDDLVDVKAPSGQFHLDSETHGPVVLIGGGVGITPALSMLNYITATGSSRETWLFYGVRDSSQQVQREYLRQLGTENENVRLNICFSQPGPNDELGRDFDHAEWVTVDLLKRLLPSNNYDFFICGPAAMMDSLTHDLTAWGVPKSKIHFEAFGAATVKRVSRDLPPSGANSIEVEFARSGNTLGWDGSAASLLEFAEASGIPMESGCRAGNCGSCLTAIRSGTVEYLHEPGAPVEEGTCLTCISIPKGNLVLDA